MPSITIAVCASSFPRMDSTTTAIPMARLTALKISEIISRIFIESPSFTKIKTSPCIHNRTHGARYHLISRLREQLDTPEKSGDAGITVCYPSKTTKSHVLFRPAFFALAARGLPSGDSERTDFSQVGALWRSKCPVLLPVIAFDGLFPYIIARFFKKSSLN